MSVFRPVMFADAHCLKAMDAEFMAVAADREDGLFPEFVRTYTVPLCRIPQVSATTQRLIDLLIERDQAGLAKYGTTLDRTDLSHTDWLQHQTEELLDAAGYAQAAVRTYQEQGK